MRNTTNFDPGWDVYFLVVKDLDGFREWYDQNRFVNADRKITLADGSASWATVQDDWPTRRKLALSVFPDCDWLKANNEPFMQLSNASDWARMWFGYSPIDLISGVGRGIIDYRVIPCWSPSQVRVPDAEWVTFIDEFESLDHLTSKLRFSDEPLQIVQILNTDGPVKVVLKRRRIVPYFEDRELPKDSD